MVAILKTTLHPRNRHRERYDFEALSGRNPTLSQFVKLNAFGDKSIDFANPAAVIALNQALLSYFYHIHTWQIPKDYLCPPIPSRADYLHYIADVLNQDLQAKIPTGVAIRVLDIGVGANMIYPLIGHREYGWQFVGIDIDPIALQNAQSIIEANTLADKITLRLQANQQAIFTGIIQPSEYYALTMCNPPFHGSLAEATAGTERKLRGLNTQKARPKQSQASPTLNFGGQQAELYCAGGEIAFLSQMIRESKLFATQNIWFTTLVSKAANLPKLYAELKKIAAVEVKTINMQQGQKQSRVLAWTFLHQPQRKKMLQAFNIR